MRQSADKSARKSTPKVHNAKSATENPPQNPLQIPQWKHASSGSFDRLGVPVSLCHLSGLLWLFNRNQKSMYKIK